MMNKGDLYFNAFNMVLGVLVWYTLCFLVRQLLQYYINLQNLRFRAGKYIVGGSQTLTCTKIVEARNIPSTYRWLNITGSIDLFTHTVTFKRTIYENILVTESNLFM